MYKVVFGLDQFRHALKNGFIDNTAVFLYSNAVVVGEESKIVLRAIDKGFNSSEIIALIDFLSLKRHCCIRHLDMFEGCENNYRSYDTREDFVRYQVEYGRDVEAANKCFDIIERISNKISIR